MLRLPQAARPCFGLGQQNKQASMPCMSNNTWQEHTDVVECCFKACKGHRQVVHLVCMRGDSTADDILHDMWRLRVKPSVDPARTGSRVEAAWQAAANICNHRDPQGTMGTWQKTLPWPQFWFNLEIAWVIQATETLPGEEECAESREVENQV